MLNALAAESKAMLNLGADLATGVEVRTRGTEVEVEGLREVRGTVLPEVADVGWPVVLVVAGWDDTVVHELLLADCDEAVSELVVADTGSTVTVVAVGSTVSAAALLINTTNNAITTTTTITTTNIAVTRQATVLPPPPLLLLHSLSSSVILVLA